MSNFNDRISMASFAILALVLVASMIGCGPTESTSSARTDTSGSTPKEGSEMQTASFVIGGTEFGIDLDKSSFIAEKDGDYGDYLIDLEIYGSKDKLETVNADYDSSEWSWASYPPHFYLREFPGERLDGSTEVVAGGSTTGYEVAIYMMQHSDVSDLKISINPQSILSVAGRVDLLGKEHDFEIRWKK